MTETVFKHRKSYELSLVEEPDDFPDLVDMVETQPSRVEGESWYFFAEVEEKSSQPGAFVCHDKIDSLFMVLFDKALEKEAKQVHQGYTLVLKNAHARLTTFVHTIAVNDARNLKILKKSLNSVVDLSEELAMRSAEGLHRCCWNCEGPSRTRCSACRLPYCSKVCQSEDWESHITDCHIFQYLLELNRSPLGDLSRHY